MKKILVTAAALMLSAVSIAGCTKTTAGSGSTSAVKETSSESEPEALSRENGSDEGQDDSLEYILGKKEFVMGLDSSFPPMGFLDDDQNIIGFDIDLAREVAARMGVELKLQPINWAAKELELSTKNIDCIWNGMTINEDRKLNMTLSKTYMKNTQVIVVLADSEIKEKSDLKGRSVVIQNGSTAQDAVEGDQDFKNSLGALTMVEDNIKAMLDMKIGASDAVIMDEVVARYYTELESNKGQYKILEDTLSDEEYAVGFRKGDEALCNEVNRILEEMQADGTLAKISEFWFASDITVLE